MKTLTQIVLPLAALGALVFGITYIVNFTREQKAKTEEKKHTAAPDALKFSVSIGRKDPEDVKFKYWRNTFELGEEGHYDFWFQNVQPQPVGLLFTNASCTCAGADLLVIPPEVWSSYLKTSALSGWPGVGNPVLAAFNTAMLSRGLQTTTIEGVGKKAEAIVPAATADGPQWGMLRLNWKAKDKDGDRTLEANFNAQLPNAPPSPLHFEAKFVVVSPFDVFAPSSGGRGIRFGELGPSSITGKEFYIWSRTRPEMVLTLTLQSPPGTEECIVITPPKPLNEQELAGFALAVPDATGAVAAYRSVVTVHERREIGKSDVKQLDIGPLDFNIKVETDEGKSQTVPVTGIVRGDVRLVGAQSSDRIDFGASFPSSESRSAQVTVMAERSDLHVELDREASSPDYLEMELTPGKPKDGRNFWTLRVTIPAGKLYGNLSDAFIVLKTKEMPIRRIRIPIKANTYDSGPRF